jgi:hypothetical protein
MLTSNTTTSKQTPSKQPSADTYIVKASLAACPQLCVLFGLLLLLVVASLGLGDELSNLLVRALELVGIASIAVVFWDVSKLTDTMIT